MIRVLLRMLCCSGRARAGPAHPDTLFSSFYIPQPHGASDGDAACRGAAGGATRAGQRAVVFLLCRASGATPNLYWGKGLPPQFR
jgi:hypothetical protein